MGKKPSSNTEGRSNSSPPADSARSHSSATQESAGAKKRRSTRLQTYGLPFMRTDDRAHRQGQQQTTENTSRSPPSEHEFRAHRSTSADVPSSSHSTNSQSYNTEQYAMTYRSPSPPHHKTNLPPKLRSPPYHPDVVFANNSQYSLNASSISACTIFCIEAALQFLTTFSPTTRTPTNVIITPDTLDNILQIGSHYAISSPAYNNMHMDAESVLKGFKRYSGQEGLHQMEWNQYLAKDMEELVGWIVEQYRNVNESRPQSPIPIAAVVVKPPETVLLALLPAARTNSSGRDHPHRRTHDENGRYFKSDIEETSGESVVLVLFDSHPRPPTYPNAYAREFRERSQVVEYLRVLLPSVDISPSDGDGQHSCPQERKSGHEFEEPSTTDAFSFETYQMEVLNAVDVTTLCLAQDYYDMPRVDHGDIHHVDVSLDVPMPLIRTSPPAPSTQTQHATVTTPPHLQPPSFAPIATIHPTFDHGTATIHEHHLPLQNAINQSNTRMDRLEQLFITEIEEKKVMQRENRGLKAECAGLREELRRLSEENKVMQREIRGVKAECAGLREELSRVGEELEYRWWRLGWPWFWPRRRLGDGGAV
ncbi:hypothetical protein HK102_012917 [Quaeritorhiza haematococci]|nr:hypothetical protein HK102_012917 [Quaeritorhiza haematococci]